MEFCNQSRVSISIFKARAPITGIFESDYWKLEGWYTIKSGDCQTFTQNSVSYEKNHSNQLFGFVYSYRGTSNVPFKPKTSNAVIPGLIFDSDASDRFESNEIQVCAHPTDAFEYKVEHLAQTACSNGGILLPLTIEFKPTGFDVDDEVTVRLKINIDDLLDK